MVRALERPFQPVEEVRSMKDRWDRLLAALGEVRDMLRHPQGQTVPVVVGGDADDTASLWDACRERLEEVLLPTDEHGRLLCNLENGKTYHEQGESGAALWEVVQAIRRARSLRRLYC
jgi:hypothetical protein